MNASAYASTTEKQMAGTTKLARSDAGDSLE